MSHWWRAYDEAVDDPKLCLLSDRAHRAWFNLMCVASAYDGILPEVNVVAVKLRMPPAKVRAVVGELIAAGLIDDIGGVLQPHNWNGRQYKSDVSTERVKRFRKQKRNVSSAVSETPPDNRLQSSVPNGTGATAPPDPKKELFDRGRKVLGRESGGLISKLLKACGPEDDPKSIAKARARIEDASTKANPAEWLGRILAPRAGSPVLTESGQPWPEGIV
jgi:hypothetical protein